MKKYAPFLLLLLLITFGCNIGKKGPGTYHNEQIDKKLRAEIGEMNKKVYTYMCSNDFDALSAMFSDTLMDAVNTGFTQKFIPQMARVMKGKNYRIFDEFYTVRAKARDTLNLISGKGDDAYNIVIFGMTPETYTSMLVSGDSLNEVMLTVIYAKIKNKWKVNLIMGEDYSLNGRNAPGLLHYARRLQKEGHIMDAVTVMGLTRNALTPGGKYFKYNIDSTIRSFTDSINAEATTKYPIPYPMPFIKTKPLVFNVHYEVYNSVLVPQIMYLSSVSVKDTVALKQENDLIQEKIGAIFPGLDINNRSILYRAYNNQPNGENDPPYYGFAQKVR